MNLVIGTAPHNTWRHVVEGVGEQIKQKASAVAYVIIVSF
jgi:hypothetical protein